MLKRSEIYRKAAERMAMDGGWSCLAVSDAENEGLNYWESPAAIAYARTFVGRGPAPCDRLGHLFMSSGPSYNERWQHRLTALCFMAAIAEWDENHA